MSNKLVLISTVLAICGAITFVSCSQEDDFLFGTDLSIGSQIPMTRAAGEQIYEEKDPNQFSYEENECCLIALVELQQQKMFERSFTEDNPASKYYDKYKSDAMSMVDSDGKPRYTGGAMDHEVFLELGKKHGLLKEKLDLSDEGFKCEVFTNPSKYPSVIYIYEVDEKKQQTSPHVARVTRVKGDYVYYSKREDGREFEKKVKVKDVLGAWR